MSGLREALKEAIRILESGRRGYVGDHYIREVQVNERTIERLRAALDAAPGGLDVERYTVMVNVNGAIEFVKDDRGSWVLYRDVARLSGQLHYDKADHAAREDER